MAQYVLPDLEYDYGALEPSIINWGDVNWRFESARSGRNGLRIEST